MTKRAWITGASSGLGRALALELAAQGWHVYASARNTQALERLAEAQPGIEPEPLDVTSGAECQSRVEAWEREHRLPTLAVLNAGYYQPSPLADLRVELFERHMAVNYQGVLNCLLPLSRALGAGQGGQIAITASVAGFHGLPASAPYSATKAALINLAESLEPELALQGIRLRLINPGFVRTPLTDKNRFKMPFILSPETAARALARGLQGTGFEIAFPRRMVWLMKGLRLLPYPLSLALTRKLVPEAAHVETG